MDIKQTPSPNVSSRKGRAIIAIVDHITSGNFPGCLEWLTNPDASASAHYIVNRAGEVYQLVQDDQAAWHAGIWNHGTWSLYDGTSPNRYTIGIEHEGFDGSLTEAQYQATLELHRLLIARHKIPVDRDHIIGHYQIDSINRESCPGPRFPWARLMNDLETGGRQKVKINILRDGGYIDYAEGYKEGDTSYGPVRKIGEAMGGKVNYDDSIKTVTIEPDTWTVEMDGKTFPGIVSLDRGYVAIRELAAMLGKHVDFQEKGKKIVLK